MTYLNRPFLIRCTFACLFALLAAACSTEPTGVARADVTVEFRDLATGSPLPNLSVTVGAIFEGETEAILLAEAVTGSNGVIDGTLTHTSTGTATNLVFFFSIEETPYVMQEIVNLEFRRSQPYDSVDLAFEVALP